MTYLHSPHSSGTAVFFTLRLAAPGTDLLTRHIDLLRSAVRRTMAELPFGIDAWVTLPDHLHCIWKLPPGEADHAARWALIQARFTRALGQPPKQAKPVWQPNTWQHFIRGPQEHQHLTRFCWMNPVKHELVDAPGDWLYSSWHRERLHDITERCAVVAKRLGQSAQALDQTNV
jgi:putative transposase